MRVFFQDEGRYGRINTPKDCWAPFGIRPIVGKQIVREYTYAYIAIDPKEGKMDSLILPNMYTPTMSFFLKELSSRYPNNFLLIIMDGAPCHRSQELSVPNNMSVVHIPPYSPQLNPCENMFDETREKYFPNLVFNSMDAVENQLVFALNDLENNPEKIKSISSWNWILKWI